MENLKLFVREGPGVLQDYTPGMVCVLAPDIETALKLIEEKGEYPILPHIPVLKYKVIEKPEAFICSGGG